jgi:hypothetical protein
LVEKKGFSCTLQELRSLEGSIWVGCSAGMAAFPFLRYRENDKALAIDKLLVRYFIPTPAYVKQALKVDGVAFYMRDTNVRSPFASLRGL